MKIVIAGGTGQVGRILERSLEKLGHTVRVLSRSPKGANQVCWDGRTLGAWTAEIDGSDAVINLAGRIVDCRYHKNNLAQMLFSRVDSARAIGEAIAMAKSPPKVWLQMSTATQYAHRYDAPNDEFTGIQGGNEPGVPEYWRLSVNIAHEWERMLREADTPHTRKIALRTTYTLSPDPGGIFDWLFSLVRWGWGGNWGEGKQRISWIHETDFVAAILFLLERSDLDGAFNLASPDPIPQREFTRTLQEVSGTRLALSAAPWMLEVGAWLLNTDAELIVKSRYVVPTRLLKEGFVFQYPTWKSAAEELVARWNTTHRQE